MAEAEAERGSPSRKRTRPDDDDEDPAWMINARAHDPLWRRYLRETTTRSESFGEWLLDIILPDFRKLERTARWDTDRWSFHGAQPAWAKPSCPINWGTLCNNRSEKVKEAYVAAVIAAGSDGFKLDMGDPDTAQMLPVIYNVLYKIFPLDADNQSGHDTEMALRAFQCDEAPLSDGSLASTVLLEAITAQRHTYYNNLGKFVAPYTSLVGPSGIGKTYAVQQLARTHGHYVVYVCLPNTAAAPVPSQTPGLHLNHIQNLAPAERFWARFLRVGLALVDAAVMHGISAGDLFAMQISGSRDNRLSIGLAELYDSRETGDVLHDRIERLLSESQSPRTTHVSSVSNTGNKNKVATAGDGAVKPPLLFCFDEARALFHRDGPGSAVTEPPVLLRGLRRALRNHANPRVFTLLLDTSSRVSNFLPSATYDPSQKVPRPTSLLPPITTLPTWDVVVRTQSAAQQWLQNSLADVRDTSLRAGKAMYIRLRQGPDGSEPYRVFLYSLGRPLWGAMIAAADDRNSGIDLARRLAASKIGGNAKWNAHGPEHSMAILSYRIQFYVSDQSLAKELLAQWLHFPVRVSDDREYIETTQPSEPILATAARNILWHDGYWRQAVQHFSHFYANGTQTKGDAGEMVASILLLLAADSVPDDQRNIDWRDLIPVSAFLASLLATGSSTTTPKSRGSSALAGLVHLTHIGRFCSDGPVTGRHLQHAFLAGQAWLLKENAIGADLLIPVWDPKTKEMGAILVQVKNRTSAAHVRPSTIAAAHRSFDEALANLPNLPKHLVIGLFLDLRPHASDGMSEVKWLRTQPHVALAAVVAGCDASAYAVLAKHDEGGEIAASLRAILRGSVPGGPDTPAAIKALLFTRDGKTSMKEEVADE